MKIYLIMIINNWIKNPRKNQIKTMIKHSIKTINIHFNEDKSRTFWFKNTNLRPFSVELHQDLFKRLMCNQFFKARGFQGTKYFSLQGFTPWQLRSDHSPCSTLNEVDLFTDIHGVIRMNLDIQFQDYLNALEEFNHYNSLNSLPTCTSLNNVVFPCFKFQTWSVEQSYTHQIKNEVVGCAITEMKKRLRMERIIKYSNISNSK